MLYNSCARLKTERSDRDNDTFEQQKLELNIKICADLNRNRSFFQCQVHNNDDNRLESVLH